MLFIFRILVQQDLYHLLQFYCVRNVIGGLPIYQSFKFHGVEISTLSQDQCVTSLQFIPQYIAALDVPIHLHFEEFLVHVCGVLLHDLWWVKRLHILLFECPPDVSSVRLVLSNILGNFTPDMCEPVRMRIEGAKDQTAVLESIKSPVELQGVQWSSP